MLNEIQNLNPWWNGHTIKHKIISRPKYSEKILKRKDKLIDLIVGTRPCGKTMLIMELISNILKTTKSKNIIYITGELPNIKNQNI